MTKPLNLIQIVCISLMTLGLASCNRADYAMAGGDDEMASSANPYAKSGFYVEEKEGRLWVFKNGSAGLEQFETHGEPAKFSTAVGAGPGGLTIRSDSKETIIAYLGAKKGYHTDVVDGRLWILKEGSESLEQFLSHGEPAKNVSFVGKGPLRCTVRSDSKETYIKYIAEKDGFWTEMKDGRLWILEKGTEAYEHMMNDGDIAKNITMIGKGPMGVSIRSYDKETVLKWAAKVHGFNTYIREGRVWVFKPGSEHEAEFLSVGEPAKSITKVGAGPLRSTIRAAEEDVLHHYIRATM